MAIKKFVAVRLGVTYDSCVTNRKKRGLPVRAPLPPICTPVGRLVVIRYSQPAGINKNTTTNKWKLLLFDWKSDKTTFLDKNLKQDIILTCFVRNRFRIKILLIQAMLSFSVLSFESHIHPQPSRLRLTSVSCFLVRRCKFIVLQGYCTIDSPRSVTRAAFWEMLHR
jgi:hypothetical protein